MDGNSEVKEGKIYINIFPNYIKEITHVIPVINEEGKYVVIMYLTEERKVMSNTSYDTLEEARERINGIHGNIRNVLEEKQIHSIIPVYENNKPVKFTFFMPYNGYFFNNIYQPSFRVNNNGTKTELVISSPYYPSVVIDNYIDD